MPAVEIGLSYKVAFRNDPKDQNFGKTVKVRQRDEHGDCLVMLESGRQLRYHESLLRSPSDFEVDNEDLLSRQRRRKDFSIEYRSV